MAEPRQPTFDELRARLPIKGAKRIGLYAGVPGRGPDGKTCHDCGWLTYTGHSKRFPKCGKTQFTCGDATTIRTRTAACQHFSADDQVPIKYRPASGENRFRQHNEPNSVAHTP